MWALQAVLALLYLAGGAFEAFNPDDVAKQITTVPRPGWVALAAVYASHSRKWTASNPLVFALPMGLVAAFVAYGRYVLAPLG